MVLFQAKNCEKCVTKTFHWQTPREFVVGFGDPTFTISSDFSSRQHWNRKKKQWGQAFYERAFYYKALLYAKQRRRKSGRVYIMASCDVFLTYVALRWLEKSNSPFTIRALPTSSKAGTHSIQTIVTRNASTRWTTSICDTVNHGESNRDTVSVQLLLDTCDAIELLTATKTELKSGLQQNKEVCLTSMLLFCLTAIGDAPLNHQDQITSFFAVAYHSRPKTASLRRYSLVLQAADSATSRQCCAKCSAT